MRSGERNATEDYFPTRSREPTDLSTFDTDVLLVVVVVAGVLNHKTNTLEQILVRTN